MEPATPCRHEYILIFQRKLKGIDRRLTATKAWLPVGFKPVDLGHLSEGSYCFCSRCRARLFPKRTTAEKAQARAMLAAEKQQAILDAEAPESELAETIEDTAASERIDIHVEELEVESVELADLEETAVSIDEGGSCGMTED
jgi:hypothetical protein